jgi:hypothetical protein
MNPTLSIMRIIETVLTERFNNLLLNFERVKTSEEEFLNNAELIN